MKVKTDKSAKLTMPTETHKTFNQITANDLSAILFKDSSKTSSQLERDAGFCSGGSEIGDDYQSDRIQSSPSSIEASEDSIDIKYTSSITIPPKRKALNAIKCENDIPLKKRFKFEKIFQSPDQIDSLNAEKSIQSTFRPWAPEPSNNDLSHIPNEAEVLARHPAVTTLHRVSQDDQPLALVTPKSNDNKSSAEICSNKTLKLTDKAKSEVKPKPLNDDSNSSLRSMPQRNYKNMTRERRIEANARERTRVHTISAAFDTLRQAIPSYSNTQKLSKLSILRVACAYILTLSRMTGLDYSEDQSAPSIQSCLEEITKTIQTEGKVRKRKDEKDE